MGQESITFDVSSAAEITRVVDESSLKDHIGAPR
jgi:hypothetical protein